MTKKRCLSIGMTALSILSIVMLSLSTIQARANVSTASTPPKTLASYIPSAVTGGQARLIGHHLGTDQLALAIGLPLRNQQALTQLLNQVSTPHNPRYRHYLTQAQANQAFNPTPQQEQQVISWLKAHGLTIMHTYPNHLLVDVTGTFAQIEQAFHVTINDYSMPLNDKSVTFYAPANQPTVDSSVSNVIDTILGFDDYPSFSMDASLTPARPTSNGIAANSPPYYPQDFANAYDVNPLWKAGNTGVGQHIGIVLWAPPPSDNALTQFATQTGADVATQANGRLQIIPVDGGSQSPVATNGYAEAGMDVEYTSGMAPGATIDYYEAPDTKQGGPTSKGLEDALNLAGTDANDNQQISDSWHWGCEPTLENTFIKTTEQILQSNTATGHDYFFSSGDSGSACGSQNPWPSYPTASAYVTSVGGTQFSNNINGSYPQETAWNGSGGGYSILFPEPAWQTSAGISDPNNMRGFPDIAADANSQTGAYICYDVPNQSPICTNPGLTGGGTSLATPLWAGMIADVNQYVQSQGQFPLGFINPMLYEMKKGLPHNAFHDIMQGTNGTYPAGKGWDPVTGLGSPDLYNLARDAADLLDTFDGYLSSVMALSATNVWAVGAYSYSTFIEHWNGKTWKVVPSPNPGSENDLTSMAAVSANDIWAVGSYYDSNLNEYTLIEHWDGSRWKVVPSPNPGPPCAIGDCSTLFGVAVVSSTDVWAVGNYIDSAGYEDTLIEHWDGSTWSVVPSPNPGSSCTSGAGGYCDTLYKVAAVSATEVWAVGYYIDSIGNEYTLIEQWNGSAWNVAPSPSPGGPNDLYGVTAVSATEVWAVGSYYNPTNSTFGTLVEQWNGNSWNVVPSSNPPSQDQYPVLRSVAAASSADIWAVGYYEKNVNAGLDGGLIEHWDGSTWKVVPSPIPGYGNDLTGVAAVSATDAWAVGYYQESNGSGTLIEHWNGSTWNVVWKF